ncbi:hypothetical protein TYRP_023072 [Tyrophagus putrescentiae]|nr:hypothetical protein TYRP_023072 [Tyrophagus putrescentiae]
MAVLSTKALQTSKQKNYHHPHHLYHPTTTSITIAPSSPSPSSPNPSSPSSPSSSSSSFISRLRDSILHAALPAMPTMAEQETYHIRLVTLGATNTGKSAILKRFLFNTFCEKHRPTVEDLFTKDFSFGGTLVLKVDFLDTEGSMQFPAMRRLSIANANAFLLVYSIDSPVSFEVVKQCFEEIKEIRSDFQEVPMIFLGNKQDLDSLQQRLVLKEDVAEWVFCELPKLRTKVMECSAKTNFNVKEVFLTFQQLARIPMPNDEGLKRRSSAQARVNGKNKQFAGTNSLSPSHANTNGTGGISSSNHNSVGGGGISESLSATSTPQTSPRLKPRSRSLIRRTSKKFSKSKEQTDADDCTVS